MISAEERRVPLGTTCALAIAALAMLMAAQPATAAEKKFTVTVQTKRIDIGAGLTYDAWTYGGTVPGPVMRVTEGDQVDIHLVNDADVAHGLDVHAAGIAPNKHFMPIPGKTDLSYSFVAEVPGVFMYHCSAPPMVTHIANGMYGMFIVAPKRGWPPAHEVTIEQGEFYGDPDNNGLVDGDSKRMMDERPDFVVFNGKIEQYVDHPIPIKVGERYGSFSSTPDLTAPRLSTSSEPSSARSIEAETPPTRCTGFRASRSGRATARSSSSASTRPATIRSSITRLRAPTKERSVFSERRRKRALLAHAASDPSILTADGPRLRLIRDPLKPRRMR